MGRAMKDSGVEWIGEIPEEWNLIPLKRFTKINNGIEISEKVDRTSENAIPVYGSGGIFKYTNKPLYSGKAVLFGRKGTIGKPIYVNTSFWTVDTMYFLTYAQELDEKFSCYQLMVFDWDHYVTKTALPSIVASQIVSCEFPIPPINEQRIIVGFLDSQCAEIGSILEKTRSSIEEYKHLKQAVITQAVTKGVRGERPMKESGIEWVDKIPKELRIARVGLLFDIILGKMLCSTPLDNSYTLEPYYCAADVHFDGISSETERKQMWFSPAEKDIYLVKSGDLLIVEGGAGAGGCAIVANQTKPTYIQNSIMIVRPKGRVSVNYLRYWIECLVKQGYIDVVCNKATIPHFTKEKLANVPIPAFSSAESVEIASYLDEKCAEIDALITQKEQLLTELENYKKSLIYEYVTGKKEVPS